MLSKIFVIPSSGKTISKAGFDRLVKSCSKDLCVDYMICKSMADVNAQKKDLAFYGVFFDNEYFDPRLVHGIFHFILYSRGYQMLSVFKYQTGGEIKFMPRLFEKSVKLNPDLDYPLPPNADFLKFEKILDGWLYCD